jgi:hypothetical protein
MQDRYAGDIGDYVKLALLRALSPGHSLGVAWYLYPDEDHNADGRHIGYLAQPDRWRHLDPDLFDTLANTVVSRRSVAALESCGALPDAVFASERIETSTVPAPDRCAMRRRWFSDTLDRLADCDLVFADPDNGLVDDSDHRRRQKTFGKQMPLGEALALTDGRQAVIYHHNTRYPGGHDLEVAHWRRQLSPGAIAVRANAYSCRTFFVVNPSPKVRERAEAFCARWHGHKVRLDA